MKKLLSILVGLFLGLSVLHAGAEYHDVTIYGYALGEGISEDGIKYGGGTITIKAESASYNRLGLSSYKQAFTKKGESISGEAQEAKFDGIFSSGNAGVKVTLSGTPYTGFYLAGFTEGKSLTGTLFSAGTITRGYVGENHNVYYSAIFKRILSVKSQTNILAWENNGSIQSNDANIVAAVYDSKSGDVLNVAFIDDPNDLNDLDPTWFQCVQGSTVTSSITLATDYTFKFSVRYNGSETNIDNIKNKNVTIKLTAKDNKDVKIIKIKIKEPPLLTFKGTGGKGKYSVSLFSEEQFDTNSAGDYPMVVMNNNLLKEVELSLKSDLDNNSIFFGWRVTNDELGKDEILSMAETTTKDFAGGDVIEAVFIPNTCGYMIMHDEGAYYEPGGGFIGGIVGDSETEGWVFDMKLSNSTMYYDMQQAVDAAELLYKSTMKKQFVVLENLSTIFKKLGINRTFKTLSTAVEATLPHRIEGYTIPANVTLLIPADNTYMYATGDLDPKRYGDGLKFSPYRKLIVERGTQITVNGSISVFAKLNYVHPSTSNVVGTHGILELQDGVHIDVYGGLYVMGYIINPQNTTITEDNLNSVGHITARSGATIYEVLQLQDWRGGTATVGMLSSTVFPLNQYYVQNIEAPITFENGSHEYLTAAILAQKSVNVVHPLFIKPQSDTKNVGYFELGEGTFFTKYYDWSNDRLKCIAEGSLNHANPTAYISNMALNLSLASIDSKNFVLPITNNIDIRVKNLTIKMSYDVSFLPGSTLTIEDNAKGYIDGNASVFVYDKEWSTTNGIGTEDGYFGQYNLSKILLPQRPGGFKTPRRTIDEDATILIDGMLEVGPEAAIYTTAEGTEGYSYGAKIISTDNGRIKFGNIGEETYTQQVTQSGDQTLPVEIPVSSARLRNANGTYVKTTTEDKEKTYMYVEGEWKTQEWTLPTIKITLPTQVYNDEVGYLIVDGKATDEWIAKIEGDGFTFDGQNTTKEVSGYDITIPIQYDAQNKHGEHTAILTLTNKANSSKIYSTTITATEDYTPKFSASSPVDMPMTYIGSSKYVTAGSDFQIKTISGNVTALMNDAESEYYQSLSWKPVSNNSQFAFTFGVGRDALSNAKITFTPTIAESQSATITLTATYTDANGTELTNTEEVKMVVNAEGKNLAPNTLKLTDDCIAALENMCVNVPIELEFEERTTNANDLILEFEDNGNPAVLTYTGSGTAQYPFVVTANAIPTSTMPTIKITQAKDFNSGVDEGVVTCPTNITKCTPIVQWNWSDMYFGYSYENPIKSNSQGNYTLTLKSITRKNGGAVTPANVMSFDANAKTAEVNQNASDNEYVATFEFSQEESDMHAAYPTTTFTANIYASPAQLPLCVDNERKFTAVNYAATDNGVNYNTANNPNTIDIAAGASWTMTFVGVPDILSFTPTANTRLTVEQSENGISFGTVFFNTIVEGQNYQVELAPATKYVKFTVVDATAFSSLCLTALNRVRLEPKILYMPIADDPETHPTIRTIKATYVNNSNQPLYMISSDGSNIMVSPEKLEPTAAGEYKEIDLTISSKATSEFAASVSVEHKEGGHAQVDIETYRFPQKLPIQLEKGIDPAKRFHFVTTAYKNSEWDATQYAVKMQNKTTTEAERPFVTFAFGDAPSFISFVPVVATSTTDWLIKEGVDATSLNPVKVEATMENGELKQTLDYNSRYVSVTYVGTREEVVQMTKVNILSDQSAIPNPEKLELTDENKYVDDWTVGKDLNLTVVNLTNLSVTIDNECFALSYDSEIAPATTFTLDADDIDGVFGEDVVGAIPFKVFWDVSQATDFGNITFTTEVDGGIKTLATVPLVATKAGLTEEEIIYTGVKNDYILDGKFEGIYGLKDEVEKSTEHRKVDLSSTYDQSGKPLFDYLIIYGETTTTDGTTTITTPTTTTGSNAKTPMYIYNNDNGSYKFLMMEENVNTANKAISSLPIAEGQQLRIYITGFCPYATTGYTKEDEGVWYFQGVNNAKLDIYLEDCYIYSRNKTLEGRSFSGRYDGQAFSEPFVCGSGGVLVFENQDNKQSVPFNVSIHTRRNNMLKSNYGCFFELMKGMRAFQVSSPIQVRLTSSDHKANSKTTLTFDDKWPTDADYSKFDRTNGYLSLQKQHNNAPSIDLGNANTIVNFWGGRVELQNAAVVSPNYKTTLAISFRSGLMAGFPMAYGIGTDDVGGTVNFYDGTTTVIPMEVDIKYRDYYLMDTETKVVDGVETLVQSTKTSCLRTPTKTFVYGGSHCMMRACEDVTSKGGAPTRNGKPLGIYKYPKNKPAGAARGGFGEPNAVGLVTPSGNAQGGVPDDYNVASVTPETNGTSNDNSDDYLNFWFTTEEESSVKPEVDKMINFWKACMTEISAEYMSYGGTIGGKTMMLPNQEVKNFLYCQIDENIHNVIYAGTGEGEDRKFTYEAPVKDPTGQLEMDYLSFPPSYVGEEWQNYVETVEYIDPEHPENSTDTGDDYEITEKIYYIVPASADTWMTFTAPFNVQKLWVVETYDEEKLEKTKLKKDEYNNELSQKKSVLIEQATHNADFAAFFGVALALGRDQSFEEIYRDYLGWAMYKDNHKGTVNEYTKRGMVPLTHYDGSNFYTANYYLYKNNGLWTRNGDKFDTKWEVVGDVADNEILMHQGETYSMLFPYCTGCDVLTDEDGNIIKDEHGLPIPSSVRDYWDYWSGKFLIFESTKATSENPHKIKGSKYHDALFAPANSGNGNTAVLTGNSTFAKMYSDDSVDKNIYTYIPEMGKEGFANNSIDDGYGNVTYQTIEPTVAFLIADIQAPANMVAKRVSRSGNITYVNKNNTTTGSHTPTVGGGDNLFVTAINGGINIAVAQPQFIRVISATGVVLYNGYVTDNVNVPLPINGIYVIKGENEAQKIFF